MSLLADMAELADALDLGSSVSRRAGSSPVIRIVRKFGTFKRLTRDKSRSFLRFDIYFDIYSDS